MAKTKQCTGIVKESGLQCKKPSLPNKKFCLFHDPEPRSIKRRLLISHSGGQIKRLIGKIPDFNGKTSGDFAEALRRILNQMIQSGSLRTLKDAQTFRSLLDSFVKLEASALVPARMAEVEKMLSTMQAKETGHKSAVVEPAGLVE